MSNKFGVQLKKSSPNGNNKGQGANPFGVQLKSTALSPTSKAKKRVSKTFTTNVDLSFRRQSLRKVTPPRPKAKRVDSTGKKWLRKVAPHPFTLRDNPIFGVVLRTRNKDDSGPADALHDVQEEEAEITPSNSTLSNGSNGSSFETESFLDLDFRDRKFNSGTTTVSLAEEVEKSNNNTPNSTPTKKKDDDEDEDPAPKSAPFGVRLKPARRFHPTDAAAATADPTRTYQIDLAPVKGQPGGTYTPTSRSFLEVKLKPVVRKGSSRNADGDFPQFVEFKLRHVVAPSDGGPERTVTEASFQIPILRHVLPNEMHRPGDGHVQKHDPLEDLLQMTLESLSHVVPQKRDIPVPEHNITFTLRRRDPSSKDGTFLSHCIDVKLKTTPRSVHAKEREIPSMQVKLRPVQTNGNKENHSKKPEFADIELKHVKVHEEHYDDTDHDEEDELFEEHSGSDDESLDGELRQAASDDSPSHNLRSSLPELNLGELVLDESSKKNNQGDDDDEYYEEEIIEEEEEIIEEEIMDDDDEWEICSEYDEEELPEYEYEEFIENGKKKKRKKKLPNDGWIECEEYDEVEVPDEYEYEEIVENGKKKKKKRKKKRPKKPSDDDEFELWIECDGEEEVSDYEYEEYVLPDGQKRKRKRRKRLLRKPQPPRTARAETAASNPPKDARGRPLRRGLERQRSSSLSDIDRMRRRRDTYIELKKKEAEEKAQQQKELTTKQRRDLLMWYNRMKTPNKEEMKRRVAKLPPSCDITPDDVELLPWLCKGRFLDLKVMNQLFMDDWQGTDEYK